MPPGELLSQSGIAAAFALQAEKLLLLPPPVCEEQGTKGSHATCPAQEQRGRGETVRLRRYPRKCKSAGAAAAAAAAVEQLL